MIATSDTWNQLFADAYHQTKTTLRIDGELILPQRIAAFPLLTAALYTESPGIGNSTSSCLELTYLPEADPPRGAKVELFSTIYPMEGSYHLVDETGEEITDEAGEPLSAFSAEELLVGTWYISRRSRQGNGWLSLECYGKLSVLDHYTVLQGAKKAGLSLADPVAVSKILQIAEALTGLTFDAIAENANFTLEELKQESMRAAIGYCALQAGGNWAEDAAGASVRFLPLEPLAATGWTVTEETGEAITDETGEEIAYIDESNGALYLTAYEMQGFTDDGVDLPITRCHLTGQEETEFAAGTTQGKTLEVSWPFASASQSLCDAILAVTKGYVHRGWNTDAALISPALQIGDTIFVDGVESVLAELSITICGGYLAGAGAAPFPEDTPEF